MKKLNKIFGNIILLIIFTLISLLIAEGVIRIFDIGCISFNNPFTKNLDIWRSDEVSGHDFVDNHPETSFQFIDYEFPIWTNELGCFDKKYNDEDDFILLLGDSITWGYSPFDDIWGNHLEKEVGKRVLKCGMPGYGTKEEALKLVNVVNKVDKIPELIVLGYFMNDIDSDYIFPGITVIDGYRVDKVRISNYKTGEKNVRSDEELRERLDNFLKYGSSLRSETMRERVQVWLLNNSTLYNLLRTNNLIRELSFQIGLAEKTYEQRYHYLTKSLFMKSYDEANWIKKAWDIHLNNIREIKHLSDSMGSKLLIVNIPTKEMTYKFLNPAFNREGYRRGVNRLMDFHDREGISFLDLTDDFIKNSNQESRNYLDSEKDLYWRCDPHMNQNGNYLTGLLVSRFTLMHGLTDTNEVKEKLKNINNKIKEFPRRTVY